MEEPADVLPLPECTQTTRLSKDVTVGEVAEIDVVLENESVWTQFHSVGTEMIITEQGKHMFPWCCFHLARLKPELCYSLLMDVVPADDFRHKWNGETWEVDGPDETHVQSLPCFHPDSPALGQHWMGGPVSFYEVKLIHGTVDQESCVSLRPMHRYIPRLYILPHQQQAISLEDPRVQMFTFPQTEFYAVTSFHNPKLKQLKTICNPFMLDTGKMFRHAVRDRCQSLSAVNHSVDGNSKDNTLTHACTESQSGEEPVLSDRTGCLKIKDLEVLCDRPVTSTSGDFAENVMSPLLHRQQQSVALTSSHCSVTGNARSVGCRSRYLRKARKVKSKRCSTVKYTRAAFHLCPVETSKEPDTSMQPDLEDVDGVLFLSFGVKEALDAHVVNMRSSVEPSTSSSSLIHIHNENSQCDKEEQIISQQQHVLLQHLKKLRNRQIIHPALQDVGLKLNLLNPAVSIDLHYLGVTLTSPALRVNYLQTSLDVPFATGTTNTDVLTKTEGWKKNFKNTSGQNSVDSSVNLSAFFSDELEEYLESEAQQICQRAAVFTTSSPSSVVYQLPNKSSSYVRTLNSVLQTQGVTAGLSISSTDHRNPSNVLPSKTTDKKRTAVHSRRTSSAPVRNTHCSPQDCHPFTPEAGVRGGCHLVCCFSINKSTSPRTLLKLLEQEQEAVNHSQSPTFVTPSRAEFALMSLVTSGKCKKSALKKSCVSQTVCGQDFCRLGCVCDSLSRKRRGPTHCRRLQCMFGCDCFKHKVFLIHPRERIQTKLGKIPLMAFPVDHQLSHRPEPAPIINRLWNGQTDDTDKDLIFTPTAIYNPALQKNSSPVYVPPPNPEEMEKDPVYRYLESKMTCARLRTYNSNPPPEFHIIPVPKKKSENSRLSSALANVMSQSPDKNAAESEGPEATKVLEIISKCNWEAQRNQVLKELFRCINMNLLSSSFLINIYKVDLLSTTLKKDNNGHCTLSYKVSISCIEKSRRTDDTKTKVTNQKMAKDHIHKIHGLDNQDCSGYNDKIHIRHVDNITKSLENCPLLCRVIPAGCLKAVKMLECPRPIQVNGKTYTKAKLLLGEMGSLHPANRLAAYVTGRMKFTSQFKREVVSKKLSERKPASLEKTQPTVIHRALRDTIHSPLNVFNPVSIPNLSITPSSSNPIPTVQNFIPFNTDAPTKPNIVISAAALPPGKQVVLQPVSAVRSANICQFNDHLRQLFPLPALLPSHLPTKEIAQKPTAQLPQMNKTTFGPREAASFPKRHPFIAPKILFLPGATDFTTGSTAPGLHNSTSGQTGTVSFRICPPDKVQTDSGESASTILLPGGYRLINLPVDKSSEKYPIAFTPSASHVITKYLTHDTNGETESDSFTVADAEQNDQTVHVDITKDDSLKHESTIVHIKTEPDEVPTQSPFTSDTHDFSSTHHSLYKRELLCSNSRKPVNNPETSEQSNNSKDDFVVIKIETSDETSEISQLSDLIIKNTMNVETDMPSSRLKIQPVENSWPSKLMQKAFNSFKEDTEVQRLDFNIALNTGINHSEDIFKCFSEDWTSEDSFSEEDKNIDSIEKNTGKNNNSLTKRRRRSRKAEQHKLREEYQDGQMQYDAVEHELDLCLYKRAWHLNLSARKRKRRVELCHRLDLLKRILNAKDRNMSVQDVLLQACDMIGALEHRSRYLTEKKKTLVRKHYRYISLVSQLSAGTILQHTAPKSTLKTSSHKYSVVKRPSGLPGIVLQSFSNIKSSTRHGTHLTSRSISP